MSFSPPALSIRLWVRPASAGIRPSSAGGGGGGRMLPMRPATARLSGGGECRRRAGDGRKMFIVMGAFKDVRRGLLKRGWLEDETKSRTDVHLKWTLYDTDVG
ncbi:hypothetical protein T484DRAFT_1838650 [Baffinella frigidus]|nr:hypothetical protein T484DRAFT_1838650 [Cryptophyta sp. CCMP2293]